MLPDFLAKFRPQLESQQLDYVKLLAEPLQPGEVLAPTWSKLLGHPYLPIGTPYPHDAKGQPMLPLVQINFAEAPKLPGFPTVGILQLFISPTEWYNAEDYQVLYHADVTAAPQTDFSFLTPALYEDSPVYVEHALTFSPATEYGGPEDCRSNVDFDGQSYYEYQETLPAAQQAQLDACYNNAGHKLGGYAYFTQGDPREYNHEQPTDVQLLQLDSDKQMMFGDSGVAHLFISPAALQARQFDQAYFYWDCC